MDPLHRPWWLDSISAVKKRDVRKLQLQPLKLDFAACEDANDGIDECGNDASTCMQTPHQYMWHILSANGGSFAPLTSASNWSFIEDRCKAAG